MKTQTAEELKIAMRKKLAENAKVNLTIDGVDIIRTYDIDAESMLKIALNHTTTQIEALRERLKEMFADRFAKHIIDSTIDEFLKEINDGK